MKSLPSTMVQSLKNDQEPLWVGAHRTSKWNNQKNTYTLPIPPLKFTLPIYQTTSDRHFLLAFCQSALFLKYIVSCCSVYSGELFILIFFSNSFTPKLDKFNVQIWLLIYLQFFTFLTLVSGLERFKRTSLFKLLPLKVPFKLIC